MRLNLLSNRGSATSAFSPTTLELAGESRVLFRWESWEQSMRLLGFAPFMFVACLLNAQNVLATGQNSPSKTPSSKEEEAKALLAFGQMVSDELKVLKYLCKAPQKTSLIAI